MVIQGRLSDTPAYVFVDSEESVERVLRAVEPESRVAFDTEANGLYCYHQRVCLMQITVGDETFIIDPLADLDLAPLLSLLSERELILHAADFDLRMLRTTFDFAPNAAVFDTMLGAQLLGVEELGLVTVVKRFLDIELSKNGQKSNWTRRPLAESQLLYAADDTRHLDALADAIHDDLDRLGRRDWHREFCDRVLQSTQEDSVRTDPWRIRGSGLLSSDQLVFLKFLWEWREQEAAAVDIPPFKVLGNATLMDIAIWAAEHRSKRVTDVPHLPKSMRPKRRGGLLAALRQARSTPRSEWPEPPTRGERPPSTPGFKKRVAYLQRECARIAAELSLPASVVAPRGALIEIVREECADADDMKRKTSLMHWQADLLGEIVQRAPGV